jgi:hypothetical protein
MNCFLCDVPKNNQVPILVCKCYCCSDCYNTLKSQGNSCLVCKKPLKRSGIKNKILIQKKILALDLLYSA